MLIDDFGEVLKARRIRSGSGVPCSYFTPLVNYMYANDGMDYLPASSEGEAVSIAAGMVAAGRPSFALMQNSGLGNAVNPITSLLYIYQIPVVLLVSHRGKPGEKDEPQHELMGQITVELSKLCGMETFVMQPERLSSELEDTQTRGVPAVFVVPDGTLSGGPKAPPISLRVQTGRVPPREARSLEPKLGREDALKLLLPLLNRGGNEQLACVSTTGKLSRELFELDDQAHDKSNRFYMVGSMGCAASFGLGINRAQAERPVLVLDGDGALLMKMGTMATVGMAQPSRFTHIMFDNGAHDTTGGQATASPFIDFESVALACGYQKADTVAEPSEIASAVESHLATPGPTFLRVLVRTGARKDLGRPSLKPRDQWKRFTGFLGA